MRRLPARPDSPAYPVIGLLLALLPSGCAKTPAAAGDEKAPPAPVKAVQPHEELVAEWMQLPGTTQPLPNRSAKISAAVEGRVLTLLPDLGGKPVEEGQSVRAGQVIVQLDNRIAKANRDHAAAVQHELEAEKKVADSAVKAAEIDVRRLEGLERGASGTQQRLISPVDVSKARLALEDAQAKRQGVGAKQASGLAQLKALDEQSQLYTLRSPIAGRLGAIQVVSGQTLSVGTTVADVVDLDEIDVVCFVPPSQVYRLKLGQPAQIVLSEPPESKAPDGRVVFIAVQAQAESGSFPVKVRFPNPGLRLRANTLVRVRIQTEPPKKRLVIPEAALQEDEDPPGVILVTDITEASDEKHEEHAEDKKGDKAEDKKGDKAEEHAEDKKEEKKRDKAEDKKGEKPAEGKEEPEHGGKQGKARRLQARLGVRDDAQKLVEILGLEDPEKKGPVPPLKEAWFVIEGGNGLHTDDPVKLEEEEQHEKGHD
jgi:RND family efflux transporter MFP subunit